LRYPETAASISQGISRRSSPFPSFETAATQSARTGIV